MAFAASLLFTTVLFPRYFDELRAMQEAALHARGLGDVELRAALEASAATRTPIVSALSGLVGTVMTGLVSSLVIAGFVRQR